MDKGGKAEQPKRRACDECRAKKLACSKELGGCARCKKECLQCIYSAQKPMGRPRKRPHDEVEIAATPEPASATTQHGDIIPPFDPALTMELDMSFLDFDSKDMNFFDLIDTNFATGAVPLQDEVAPPAPKKPTTEGVNTGPIWMGDVMASINFDGLDEPADEPEFTEISRDDIEQIMTAEIPEKLPSLSPAPSYDVGSETTPSSLDDTDIPPPPPTCACVSTLYLALDSLQRLPNEVTAAMKVARTASRSAHDTIQCGVCGNPPLEHSYTPPIASFQALMMLGALIPSLANAYTRILSMVDAEAAKADREHRKLPLVLEDYGGLWGNIAIGYASTPGREKLTGDQLDPALWRLTVRSLLRIDVYGLHPIESTKATPQSACCYMQQGHPGLKDIITMVEERSRKRHQQLDMALAAGLITKPNNGCAYDIGGEPPCMRIINIAKQSMNNLVIP